MLEKKEKKFRKTKIENILRMMFKRDKTVWKMQFLNHKMLSSRTELKESKKAESV